MEYAELARQCHEDVERHIDEIKEEVTNRPKNHRHRVHHEHFINQKLDQIRAKKRKLIEIYESDEATKKASEPLSKVEKNFYVRLAEIREYYRKFPDITIEEPAFERPDPDKCPVNFSGEEGYGRYLDMHGLYNEFMELPFNYELSATKGKTGNAALTAAKVKRIDYINWLKNCTKFHNIPRKWKTEPYRKYLENLFEYLKGFYERTQPLSLDTEILVKDTKESFELRWDKGEVLGWEDMKDVTMPAPDKKKLTKSERRLVFHKRVAELEELVQRFYDLVGEQLQQTLAMLERKETKSREELDAELEREEEEARQAFALHYEKPKEEEEGKEKEADAPELKQNLKNLPVGYDGQPIPYWLYKLHGLNMKFTCEICRGYTYIGPKAFDQHFQEKRHAHGMRCLKIPNTRHFHHVTKIKDAINLWDKIQADAATKQWNADNEQEYEDNEGLVFNKKTFEDMRRQGLI